MKGKGCVDHLVTVVIAVEEKLTEKKKLDAVFIDLEKPYETSG